MNKKIKVTSLTAAALATVALASANLNNEVKADTQAAGTTAKANSAVENAQANVDSAQKAVNDAQAKVDNAKSALDSANSNASAPDNAYSTQAGVVSNDQDDVNKKSAAVKSATQEQVKRQDLANEAKKPNAIDNAKKAVSDKNDDIAKKQQAVKDAQAKTPAAQKAVDDANKDLTNKQNALKDTQAAKSDADKAVKNAQDALKGTGIDRAQDAVNKAKQAVDQDKKNLDAEPQKINELTKLKDQKKNKITAAQSENDKAKADKNSAQTDYDSKKADSDSLNKQVTDTSKEITSLKDQVNRIKDLSKNTINISDIEKYKQAYIDYYTTGSLTSADIDFVDSERAKNGYVPSEADANNIVDVNNLTDDQIKELSLFVADLTSKVRKQLGMSADAVTKGSVSYAKEVAENYATDLASHQWTPGWHDIDGLRRAQAKFNLNYSTEASGDAFSGTKVNMNDLKSKIYNVALTMIFPAGNGVTSEGGAPEYEFEHASGLLGIERVGSEIKPELNDDYDNRIADAEYDLSNAQEEIRYYKDSVEEFKNDPDMYNEELKNLQESEQAEKTAEEKIEKYKKLKAQGAESADISTIITDSGNGVINIHFLRSTSDSSNYDPTPYQSYDLQINDLNKTIQDKTGKLKLLQAKQEDAMRATSAAKTLLDNTNSKLLETESAFNKANAEFSDISNRLDNEINNVKPQLENKYQEDLRTQKQAQATLDSYNGTHQELLNQYNKAQEAQAKAEEAVKAAQSAVDQAQTKLDNAEKAQADLNKDIANKQDAVKKAQDELKTLKQHVSDLENAPENLDKANKELTEAKDNLKKAQDALTKDEAKLNELKSAKDAADSAVSSAQANYDQAQSELKDAQAKLETAKNNLKTIQDKEEAKNDIKTPSTTKKSTKSNTKKSTKSEAKKVLTQKVRVYDKNGKAIKKNGKFVTYKKGAKINGKLVTIKGKKYYQVGKNEFVKADNVKANKTTKKSSVKSIKLTHTAFVYDKNGKAVRKGLKIRFIRRGKTVKALKTVTIKGKKYYQVGKNEFVKASNATLTTHAVHLTATVKAKKNSKVKTYSRKGKHNKHYVLGKKSYKFNEKLTINGKVYYKIAGKNDWVPANKLNLKK